MSSLKLIIESMEQSDEDCRKLILNLIHLLSDHVELHQADERDLDEARKMVKQMSCLLPEQDPHEDATDLVVDERPVFWNRLCGETRMLANAASFTVPQAEGDEHIDADVLYEMEPLLRKDAWAARLNSRSRKEATARDVRQYA